MRTMDPVEAFDTLYKLAIDGGSEQALFGGCAPLAREALRHSPATCPFSFMWFEVPLSGPARFDLHMSYSRDDLQGRIGDPSLGEGRYADLFRWYAAADRGSNGLALAYDVGDGRIESPAVHMNVNDAPAADMEGFFDHAAGEGAYAAYRGFEERLPDSWHVWYAGVHPGRVGSHLRVDCFVSDAAKQGYADDFELFERDLRSCGFRPALPALAELASPILESPFALELQFDVSRDGSVGDTIGVSATFPTGGSRVVRSLFQQGSAACELLEKIEGLGLADDRWKHIASASYAIAVDVDDGRLVLYCAPTFVKLRMRDGKPLDAKMYLQAAASFL